MVNWARAGEWLAKPTGSPPGDLLRFVLGKCRVKPVKPKIRLPRGVGAKVKKESLPKLKKELDRVFSIFIRTRGMNENGMNQCVTCGRVEHWKNLDAGHYVPRQDLATRWDEQNVWPQCKPCNGFRGGEPEKMAEYINRKCGLLTSIALRTKGRQSFRLTRDWLKKQIIVYKERIRTSDSESVNPEGVNRPNSSNSSISSPVTSQLPTQGGASL